MNANTSTSATFLCVTPPPPDIRGHWPGPVVLESVDLRSPWGFDRGRLLDHHADWQRHRLGLGDDHPYVNPREILEQTITSFLLPALEPRWAKAAEEQLARIAGRADSGTPVTAHGGTEVWPVFQIVVDDGIRELMNRLYPPMRACDYDFVAACVVVGIDWRPLAALLTREQPDIVGLAAENLTAMIDQGPAAADGREALHLAHLACRH